MIHIIVDTREKLLLWEENIRVTKKKLIVGDYTTQRLISKFIIERKSGEDLYGSIIHNHARFSREMLRAKVNKIELCVYVECTYHDFWNLRFNSGNRRKMKPKTLKRIIDTVIQRRGIEFIWCKHRDRMRNRILGRLRKEENKLLNKKK